MSLTILDEEFWRERIRDAGREYHHSVYVCTLAHWEQIAERHRKILSRIIDPQDSILDVGCGWGRLLDLLPEEWEGRYLGVDLMPDFLDKARVEYPQYEFQQADITKPDVVFLPGTFDWAIMISIRPMMIRHLGQEVWNDTENYLKQKADRLLFLEYDVDDLPTIIRSDR